MYYSISYFSSYHASTGVDRNFNCEEGNMETFCERYFGDIFR